MHPSPAIGGRRPYLGFDREREAYARSRAELLTGSEGRYVVFVGGEMIGPFGTHAEAERAGYATFGLGPLYIKRVLADEPPVEVSRLAV